MSETGRDEQTGRFLPGNSGFGGRPKGARNRLGEAFIQAMEADFNEHGVDTIAKVRTEKPEVYVKVIAGLLPSEHHLNITNDDVSDDELIERIRALAAIAQPFLSGEAAGEGLGGITAPPDYAGRA